MVTVTFPLTRVVPVLIAVTLAAWPDARLAATNDDSAAPTATLVSSLDTLSRQPHVSWIARRHLEAELVDKGERAWMEVVTRFERDGGLSHSIVAEGGSNRIRQRALASVLDKEIEASRQGEARRTAFSLENYRYRLVDAPWETARIELLPRRSDPRLVKGMATVDSRSGALLKVEGRLADHPSFWVRDVHVARTYARVGGVTLPVELLSTARVRMFGQARLRIRTHYLSVAGQPVDARASYVAESPRNQS